MTKRTAVLSSTGASVVRTVYQYTSRLAFDIDLVITDRECGASAFARDNQIPLNTVEWKDPLAAGSALQDILERHRIDYVYLFFTRLVKGSVLERYKEKIINFHLSLLPACPGLHGFEDTLKSGAILAGSTVHYIDNGMDSGEQLLQTFTPAIVAAPTRLRHIIFAQQCAALYYIHRTIKQGLDPKLLKSTPCDPSQGFCPNIDFDAMALYQKILQYKY